MNIQCLFVDGKKCLISESIIIFRFLQEIEINYNIDATHIRMR